MNLVVLASHDATMLQSVLDACAPRLPRGDVVQITVPAEIDVIIHQRS